MIAVLLASLISFESNIILEILVIDEVSAVTLSLAIQSPGSVVCAVLVSYSNATDIPPSNPELPELPADPAEPALPADPADPAEPDDPTLPEEPALPLSPG